MAHEKRDYPVEKIRRYLEPGPVVLVSSHDRGSENIMTMGWHMMLGFSPALFGCYIWDGDHSFEMLRNSRECVINLPTIELLEQVIGIGNSSGRTIDKFERFGLTRVPAEIVEAPMIAECFANFECRLHDDSLIDRYSLFVWEVVKAHVTDGGGAPETMHYLGEGEFMIAGRTLSRRTEFKPQNL